MLSRPPAHPALVPFVKTLWATSGAGERRPGAVERVLPTGDVHLAIRIGNVPVRVDGVDISTAVVGGARSASYVRDISRPVASVGAQLRPGAALALCGVPAGELAERHHPLELLWGSSQVERARTRLAEEPDLEQRLRLFEALLVNRLRNVIVPRLVAFAARELEQGADVGAVVDASGYSHRRFLQLFREGTGLAPKLYCRVLRLNRAVEALAAQRAGPLGELAHALGYADQPHFTREFRALTGLSPGEYRRAAPALSHHVPVGQFRSRPLAG